MNVYYFTGAPFAISNLSLRRLKVSRLSDLNDPFEMLAANLTDDQHRRNFRELKDYLNESRGIVCFSSNWNNPLLWGHYAEKHTGAVLGFEVPNDLLVKIDYSRMRVKLEVDPVTKRLVLDAAVADKLIRTKFRDWKYEDEYRLFAALDHDTKESGLHFLDFSDNLRLTQIILGLRCELPIERIRSIVNSFPDRVKVTKARLAFSTFRVIEDRNPKHAAASAA